jgi:16S rRNA (cytosine967-C5)-methyltransferase
MVYEVVRWWRVLYFLKLGDGHEVPESPGKLTQDQIHELIGLYLDKDGAVNRDEIFSELIKAPESLQYSVPSWIWQECLRQLGEESARSLLFALHQKAPVDLRVNTLKIDLQSLKKVLEGEGIQTQAFSDIGLSLLERKNIFVSASYKKGFFEVQDRSSQAVALAVDPQPGERILDACAGAGGKSLHMAMRMKNKGKIIALDIYESKLQQLRKRAARAGVDIIEVRLIEAKVIKRLAGQFDRVLLDVPCSGLGVLRRNPDSKWKLTPEKLESLRSLQREILSSHASSLKPGGVLVYSTCSVLPSENEEQIRWFLGTHHGWSLVEEKSFRPDMTGGDGFYLAKLKSPLSPA